MINRENDLECVDARESTVGLEAAIEQHLADVAVIDLVGPGRDALEAIRSTAAMHPRCRLIAFSGHDDTQTRDEAARAGAWSLVSKHDHPTRLLEEIRRAVGSLEDG
jgi:DNA-binding NarL/FixJ family response regulator